MNDIDAIKPFGYMAAGFEMELELNEVPRDWSAPPDHASWVKDMAQAIADTIWPRWQPGAAPGIGRWSGNAVATAMALTREDLALMSTLATWHDDPARQPGSKKNHWWFNKEDELLRANWCGRYDLCFESTDPGHEKLQETFDDGAAFRFTNATTWLLKKELQRPRPHQMAHWMGLKPAPAVQLARSAWSPSAISGHAFQGLFGCLNVFLLHGEKMTAADRQELQRLAVDIGDRRVFAGVHYPSDNAMSWRVAVDAARHMRLTDESRQFLVEAINSSTVYHAMRRSPGHSRCVEFVASALT